MDYNRRTVLQYFEQQKDYMDARIADGIEKYRKGDVVLQFLDQQGAPLTGVSAHVKLKNHAFNFGANLFQLDTLVNYSSDPEKYQDWFVSGYDLRNLSDYRERNQKWREEFKNMFNFATLPFYWSAMEPERGRFRFSSDTPHIHRRPPADFCLKFCEENAIRAKAHCLNYDGADPKWVQNFDHDADVRYWLENYMRECAKRYKDVIKGWEVTNETLVLYPQPAGESKFYFHPDFVHWSFTKAREYFKNNELIINDNHETVWQYYLHYRSSYYMQLKQELAQGTPIDTIGMQYHFFYPRNEEMKMAEKFYNPKFIFEVLDLYAEFGKPMQITEITIPSYSNEPQDEEIQAEILKNLYSIFFSYPNMEAIVYWNLAEGYLGPIFDMTAGENAYYGGFLRQDLSRKPAYDVLYDLIHNQWSTNIEANISDNGLLEFRGFYGDYELTLIYNGEKIEREFSVNKDTGKIIVRI